MQCVQLSVSTMCPTFSVPNKSGFIMCNVSSSQCLQCVQHSVCPMNQESLCAMCPAVSGTICPKLNVMCTMLPTNVSTIICLQGVQHGWHSVSTKNHESVPTMCPTVRVTMHQQSVCSLVQKALSTEPHIPGSLGILQQCLEHVYYSASGTCV